MKRNVKWKDWASFFSFFLEAHVWRMPRTKKRREPARRRSQCVPIWMPTVCWKINSPNITNMELNNELVEDLIVKILEYILCSFETDDCRFWINCCSFCSSCKFAAFRLVTVCFCCRLFVSRIVTLCFYCKLSVSNLVTFCFCDKFSAFRKATVCFWFKLSVSSVVTFCFCCKSSVSNLVIVCFCCKFLSPAWSLSVQYDSVFLLQHQGRSIIYVSLHVLKMKSIETKHHTI